MNTKELQDLFARYVIANYKRLPCAIVRGQGSWVWDAEGKKYLDLFPGWGVAGLGHCHPAVVAAIRQQAGKLLHIANNYYTEEQGLFAEALATRAPGYQVFFANSGAEANEAALKLARIYHQPKYKIIAFANSFHGRTFAAITATGQPQYHRGFAPLVPGFAYAKLNDLDSVKRLVDSETCAIIVEPVQGEGGVHPCQTDFLRGLRALCDQCGCLLIFDEVQTSPARLGSWFGYQYFGVEPDIITTAKAIAGGMPLGAMLAKAAVAKALVPGTHASTFGGNAICCAAGLAAFRAIAEEEMLTNIKRLGSLLDQRLSDLKQRCAAVREVRRVGFMIGIELSIPGAEIVDACRAAGLLINCTHERVLRLLPAFNVKEDEIQQGLDILAQCLAVR